MTRAIEVPEADAGGREGEQGAPRRPSGVSLGVAVGVVAAAGVAVRMVGLTERSLWFDEAMSWRTLGFPWGEMFARIARNTHAPLHYVVLRGWTAAFGDSIWALRLHSVALAAATIVVLYLFVAEAFRLDARTDDQAVQGASRGRFAGLAAAALFAASGYQIRLAWEVRMYALAVLLAVASSWLLMRALRRERSFAAWGASAVATLLLLYTHYFALFTAAAQAVFVGGWILADARGRPWRALRRPLLYRAAVAYAMVAAGWAVWLPVFLRQRQMVARGWWTPPFSWPEVGRIVHEMLLSIEAVPPSAWLAVALAAGAAALLAAAARWGGTGGRYAAVLTVLPFAAAVGLSATGTNLLVARFFACMQPFLLVAAAVLLARVRWMRLRAALLAAAVAALLGAHVRHIEATGIFRRPGMRAAVAHLEAHRGAGEAVFAETTMLYYPALYYAEDREHWHVIHEGAVPYFIGGPVVRPGEVVSPCMLLEVEGPRVWVLSDGGAQPAALPAHWRFERVARFAGAAPFQWYVTASSFLVEAAEEGSVPGPEPSGRGQP